MATEKQVWKVTVVPVDQLEKTMNEIHAAGKIEHIFPRADGDNFVIISLPR